MEYYSIVNLFLNSTKINSEMHTHLAISRIWIKCAKHMIEFYITTVLIQVKFTSCGLDYSMFFTRIASSLRIANNQTETL